MRIRNALPALLALPLLLLATAANAQEKIKVGYWTSGFSVGFGAVLEAGKFLEQAGLQPEYVKFSDVNGPTKALLTQSIDVAFAAPVSGGFTLASIHPGHTVEEVIENTGFDFDRPGEVPVTAAPAPETLKLMRETVAPQLAEVYPQFAQRVFGFQPSS